VFSAALAAMDHLRLHPAACHRGRFRPMDQVTLNESFSQINDNPIATRCWIRSHDRDATILLRCYYRHEIKDKSWTVCFCGGKCYDFLNIFAKKIGKMFADCDSNYCYLSKKNCHKLIKPLVSKKNSQFLAENGQNRQN
jgi:hypothetical protein